MIVAVCLLLNPRVSVLKTYECQVTDANEDLPSDCFWRGLPVYTEDKAPQEIIPHSSSTRIKNKNQVKFCLQSKYISTYTNVQKCGVAKIFFSFWKFLMLTKARFVLIQQN